MENIIITFVSLSLGAILSYFISKHFFQKANKTGKLTPYLEYSTRIFSIHKAELKNEISIKYKDVEVKNLYQLGFIVTNDGDIPIKDIIEPLKFTFKKNIKILDYEIFEINPIGIKINSTMTETLEETIVEFDFKLLNSGDYFGFKFLIKTDEEITFGSMFNKGNLNISINLLQDKLTIKDLIEVTITAPEIPPKLDIERIPLNLPSSNTFNWNTLTIFAVLAIVTSAITLSLYVEAGNYYIFNFKIFFQNFNFFSFAILVSWIVVIILIVLCIGSFFASLPNFKLSKNKSKFNYKR